VTTFKTEQGNRHKQEEPTRQPTHEGLAGVAEPHSEAGVSNEVGEAVSTAQKAGLGVVSKAAVCALNGGVEGDGRGRVSLILRSIQQT
jgi:hypothetical protein